MKAKRILASLALAATVFTTSCAAAPELLEFLPVKTDNSNLDGLELRLEWALGEASSVSYEIDTPQYDAYAQRIADAEKNFNCTIIHGSKLSETNFDLDLMAGAYSYDIYFGNITHYAENDQMYPMTYFEGLIDPFDEKYGGKRVLEAGMVNGIPYGVTPVMWPGFEPARGFLIAYNRDLFREHNITDLHEYYENEIWTYDTFENEFVAKTDVQDADGKQIYAMTTHGTDYYLSLISSNDVKFVKVNDDGTLSADTSSRSYINALTWGQNLFVNYGELLKGEENTHEQELYRKQAAFTTTVYPTQIVTGNIAYNDLATFVTGVMPFPCGPDATYGEWGQVIDALYGAGIPITAKSPEAAAMIIDFMCEPFEEFGGDAGLYDYYCNHIFSTDLDAEIFIASYQHPRSSYIGRGDEEMNTIRSSIGGIATNPTRSITEALASYEHILEKAIEKYIIPNYKAVYGEE